MDQPPLGANLDRWVEECSAGKLGGLKRCATIGLTPDDFQHPWQVPCAILSLQLFEALQISFPRFH